jgi:hypothetical protein
MTLAESSSPKVAHPVVLSEGRLTGPPLPKTYLLHAKR